MYILPKLKGDEIAEYLRKSRADDPLLTVEDVLSKHEQMLDEWMERNQPEGGKVPESQRFREVGSGETIESRPAMKELLRLAESPKIKAVLCVEPQRLSRGDLEDIGYLVKILRYTGTIVITLQYTYDLRDARDREQFERELMRGNDYLEYQKRIQWNGRLLSVQNGNFIGNTAPYGYRKTQIKEGKRTCHTLEPHPEEAPIVKRLFEMYRDGSGANRIADRLNAEHIPAPKGKKWSPNSLYSMLTNVHYRGKIKWNARATVKKVIDGELVKSNPRAEEYLIFEGKHPAIIDQELWDDVQAIMGSHPKNKKASNLTNPLAGLMWCKCGKAMVGRRYNDKEGNERCAPRFLCGDRKSCGRGSARMSDVLDEVVRVLRECIADFEMRIERGEDDSAEVQRKLVERLEHKLLDLQELEKRQWDEKLRGKIPEHIFEKLNQETVAEMEEVQQALCDAKGSIPEPIDLPAKVVTFQAALDALKDPDASVRDVNRLLKACIDRIEYDRERYTAVGTPKGMTETPIHLEFKLRV